MCSSCIILLAKTNRACLRRLHTQQRKCLKATGLKELAVSDRWAISAQADRFNDQHTLFVMSSPRLDKARGRDV